MGPKVGVTLLTLGYTAVNEPAFTMASLEPIIREKFWGPSVPKLVVIQANWRPGMKLVIMGEQATPPNVRVEF